MNNTISRQVPDLAQLPDGLKFNVDQESSRYQSGVTLQPKCLLLMGNVCIKCSLFLSLATLYPGTSVIWWFIVSKN